MVNSSCILRINTILIFMNYELAVEIINYELYYSILCFHIIRKHQSYILSLKNAYTNLETRISL